MRLIWNIWRTLDLVPGSIRLFVVICITLVCVILISLDNFYLRMLGAFITSFFTVSRIYYKFFLTDEE